MSVREQLLTGLTRLKEQNDVCFGVPVILRELTAEQRIMTLDTGVKNGSGLFLAMIVQQGMRDRETKDQVFTVDDVPLLADGNVEVKRLADIIWLLSEATTSSLKSSDQEADIGQSDAPSCPPDAEAND